MNDTQVAIVGGGPVGLGLAIDLALRGVSVTVVEKYRTLHNIPKGQNLTQRTGEHFQAWGIADQIEAARVIPASFGSAGVTTYKTLLSDYHYDWMKRADVGAYYAAQNMRLPQYVMEHVLRTRAAELPNIILNFDAVATDVTQTDDNAAISFTMAGNDRRVTADYVVGCDGARSIIRENVGITQTFQPNSRRMVLAVFKSAELHDLLERYPGKSYFNALHPDHHGYWQFLGRVDLGTTWFFHAPVPPDSTTGNLDLAQCLYKAVGAEFEFTQEYLGFWDLRIAVADTYRTGRVFIAGDAAHSHPPYGGYGVNNGLEDARNLGWKLAAVLQGWGGANLLNSYTAERQPVFTSTAENFIARMIREDADFVADFSPEIDRDAFEAEWKLRSVSSKNVVDNYVPNYAGSPVVVGSRGQPSAWGEHFHPVKPGYHLSPLGGIYSKLGDGFNLISVGEVPEGAGALLGAAEDRDIPIKMINLARTDVTAKWDATLILVRPDHFVAYTNRGAKAEPSDILAAVTGA